MFNLEDFVNGYITAMLWANTFVGDEGTSIGETSLDGQLDKSDLSDACLSNAVIECREFLNYAVEGHDSVRELIGSLDYYNAYGSDYAGHDFALTRNGHGAGFWDRGLGEVGEILSNAARVFGEKHFWVDDAHTVHAE